MRFALSQSDQFLSAHGFDRASLTALAEREEDFLAESHEYERTRVLPAHHDRTMLAEVTRRELAEFGPAAYPPTSFFETAGSLRPRRWQQLPAPLSPAAPASSPAPPHPGAWDFGRACLVNATNTYYSYGALAGCSKDEKADLTDGKRVYAKQPDGKYRWAVFEQQARSTLAAQPRLERMVREVGGDPADFGSRLAMADYILAREAPIGVVREEDEAEIFSGSFPVHLGQPASGLSWGFGHFGDGTLTMLASTQAEMERF